MSIKNNPSRTQTDLERTFLRAISVLFIVIQRRITLSFAFATEGLCVGLNGGDSDEQVIMNLESVKMLNTDNFEAEPPPSYRILCDHFMVQKVLIPVRSWLFKQT
jgi:hypothetical protein